MFALLTLAVIGVAIAVVVTVGSVVLSLAEPVIQVAMFPVILAAFTLSLAVTVTVASVVLSLVATILAVALALLGPIIFLAGIVWGGILMLA